MCKLANWKYLGIITYIYTSIYLHEKLWKKTLNRRSTKDLKHHRIKHESLRNTDRKLTKPNTIVREIMTKGSQMINYHICLSKTTLEVDVFVVCTYMFNILDDERDSIGNLIFVQWSSWYEDWSDLQLKYCPDQVFLPISNYCEVPRLQLEEQKHNQWERILLQR